MYLKVLVMDIKDEYCIGMKEDGTMIRIQYKEGIHIGDYIYVLEEDLYHKEEKPYAFMHSAMKNILVGAACLFIVFASIQFLYKPKEVHALVSIDGDKSVQLELDHKYRIMRAQSFNHTYTDEELAHMIGKYINESDYSLDSVVIGYALYGNDEDDIEDILEKKFGKDAYYLCGDEDNVKEALEKNRTLGLYLIGQKNDNHQLKKQLNEKTVAGLKNYLKERKDVFDDDEIDELEDYLDDLDDDADDNEKEEDDDNDKNENEDEDDEDERD